MGAHVYLIVTLGFYTVGALHVLLHAVARSRLLTSWTVTATLIGFAVHTAGLSQRWTEAGHFPASGLHDISSLLAWAIVLVFLVTYVRTRVEALGLAAYPVAFGLMAVANLTTASERVNPTLKSLFFPIHATLAFSGFAALFVACAMGVLYLIQERELKGRSPRAFYYLAPSLERCDTISGHAVAFGFGLLSLAILTGLAWSRTAKGRYWSGDPKEWISILAWMLYVGLIVARRRAGWGGRQAAVLAIVGFSALASIFVWMTVLGGAAAGAR